MTTTPVNTENAIVDITHHPLLYIQLRKSPQVPEFELIADYFEVMLEQGEQTAILVDFRETHKFRVVETARYWVTWLARNRKVIDPISIAVAGLSDNRMVTGVINSMIKISPVKTPFRMFRDAQGGLDWLFEHGERRGVTLAERNLLTHI